LYVLSKGKREIKKKEKRIIRTSSDETRALGTLPVIVILWELILWEFVSPRLVNPPSRS
jgi:hypothetical protein